MRRDTDDTPAPAPPADPSAGDLPGYAALSPAQRLAADRALAEESAQRHHLVVYLSGSHAYGFPSPDSDLDLKAVHIAPTRQLLGLRGVREAKNRLEVIDGVEIDYTSNELAPVLAGLLGGNGNYLERVLGDLTLAVSPALEGLRQLAQRALSRRVFRHYAGFAGSQRRAVDAAATPTAKKVLYVLRTALTGTRLLRSGEMVTDVRQLLDDDGFAAARELIAIKQAGEQTALDAATVAHWRGELDRAMAVLAAARDASPLPEEPSGAAALEAWLIEVRRAFWDGPPRPS